MRMQLVKLLATAELVYRTGRSREELAALADIFAEDLAGENMESINEAFDLHRKRSRFFPTPADILALLPECYHRPVQVVEKTGTITPGFGQKICEQILARHRKEHVN